MPLTEAQKIIEPFVNLIFPHRLQVLHKMCTKHQYECGDGMFRQATYLFIFDDSSAVRTDLVGFEYKAITKDDYIDQEEAMEEFWRGVYANSSKIHG